MAAWGSAAVAAPAPARRPRPGPKPRPAQRSAAARRPRLLGGVVWIAGLAALLAGIVALNVAVLQANLQLDRLAERKAALTAENVALSGQLTSAGSPPQVAHMAQQKLGLEPAGPDGITYVDLARGLRK